ncbi:MAG: Clp protease N-terminal domain-containing protein [Actinomycetota bacterium]
MFERFTPEARRIVTGGVELAQEAHHDHVGTEHLLIALAGTGPNVATRALIACGFDPVQARADLERIVEPLQDDLDEADVAALRSIGVDLDEVRRRIEVSFGKGALERRRRWHGRRRARVCGLPFMPKAKQALELALREAIRLDQRSIAPEHVLLGLLRLDAMSTQLIDAQGIDPRRLRSEVERGLGDLRRGA